MDDNKANQKNPNNWRYHKVREDSGQSENSTDTDVTDDGGSGWLMIAGAAAAAVGVVGAAFYAGVAYNKSKDKSSNSK